MKIAISGDCFSAYTSGFPVRGMTKELIKNNPNDKFIIYYTKRKWPHQLMDFYEEINNFPNVEVRYFNYSRKIIALRRLFGLKYVDLDKDTVCFFNPGNPEYISNFEGSQICSLADLSTIKGISTNKYALIYKYIGRLKAKRVYHKFDRIVCISKYTETDLLTLYPHLKGHTDIIYNGIDEFWHDDDISKAQTYSLDCQYFIWWGVISRRKNVIKLIEAYKLAKKKVPDLPKLLLIGRIEPYMSNIVDLFDENIIHIGFQDNSTLKLLVRNSCGLIFPSLYEGFGLPVIEAYSQGRPVACSNITSLPEIAGGKAILFNPNNISDIANSILNLHTSIYDPKILVQYTYQFTYRIAAEKYMKIIRSCCK